MRFNPFYKKPCEECDCPDFCQGEMCVRDVVQEDVHDSELSADVLMVEQLDEAIEQPAAQVIDFLTARIYS
jgi:hypothetical protein